jgi:GntR family transcriptional regulator
MNLSGLFVDDASPLPVYVQLREQFLAAVGRGELLRGERLPSVRDVAAAIGVNPNTVNRAYAELERTGVVATRRGLGTFVAGAKPRPEARRLVQIAERYVAHARSLGYQDAQIVNSVRDHVQRARGRGGSEA